jgi:hypothetical protein
MITAANRLLTRKALGGAVTLVKEDHTTSGAGNAITAMATVNAGDILVMSERLTISNGGSATVAAPTGFTMLDGFYDTSEFMAMGLYVKLADGTEDSSTISTGVTGISNQSGYEAQLVRFSGGAASITVGGTGNADNAGGSSIAAGSGAAPQIVLALMCVRTSSSIGSATIDGAGTVLAALDNSHTLVWLIQQDTPATVSSSYTSGAGEREIYGYVEAA